MTLHLNSMFCQKIMKKYGQYFYDKYNTLMKYVLVLDEFVYLISNFRLIQYDADRGIMHKYMVVTNKCKSDPKCFSICQEYNLNKFSYIFDGEALFIKDFMKRFAMVRDKLMDVKLLPQLF